MVGTRRWTYSALRYFCPALTKLALDLHDRTISNQLKRFIFALRARMIDIGQNYPNKYQTKYCPVCRDEKSRDTQEHFLVCIELNNTKQVTQTLPQYEDLFGKDVQKQIAVAKIIFENLKLRNKKLNKIYSESEPSEPS